LSAAAPSAAGLSAACRRDLHRARLDNPADAAYQAHPGIGEPCRAQAVVEMAGDLVTPGNRVLPGLTPARGGQHRLGRQACQVWRFASNQSCFDKGDRAAGLCQAGCDKHAGRSPAEYHDIEFGHLVFLPSGGQRFIHHDSRPRPGMPG
jgi:hypothetical protein